CCLAMIKEMEMMSENRMSKVYKATLDAIGCVWCRVNINNEFTFAGKTFVIDPSVEQYKVYKKAGEVDDFTNEAFMEEILVVVTDFEKKMVFFDQMMEPIPEGKIYIKSDAK